MSNVSYTSGFMCVLAAFLFLPLTLGTIFAQSNDRCAQALSHEVILKRIKDIPKDRIERLVNDIQRFKVDYKLDKERAQQIGSEINKLEVEQSAKLSINTDLLIEINNNFVGQNCPGPLDKTLRIAVSDTIGSDLVLSLAKKFLGSRSRFIAIQGFRGSEKITVSGIVSQGSFEIEIVVSENKLLASEDNKTDMIMSSKQIQNNRWIEDPRNTMHIVARDKLVIIVNRKNPLSTLPIGALREIYNNSPVGAFSWTGDGASLKMSPDSAISCYTRDKNSETLEDFERLYGLTDNCRKTVKGDLETSSQVSQDIMGIGYVSFPFIGNCKELLIENEQKKFVNNERYLYFYVLNQEHFQRERRNWSFVQGMARDLLEFVKSADGQAVISEQKLLPSQPGIDLPDRRPPPDSSSRSACLYSPIPNGKKLYKVSFEIGSLKVDERQISSVIKELQSVKSATLEPKTFIVRGFTDKRGPLGPRGRPAPSEVSEQYNKDLSKKRAEAVAERLRYEGFTVSEAPGCGVKNRQETRDEDRIVEIVLQ
ncbi:MAG TPA: hypothetical protein VI542_17675 [Candidatus Tectomicrobia bacterium]